MYRDSLKFRFQGSRLRGLSVSCNGKPYERNNGKSMYNSVDTSNDLGNYGATTDGNGLRDCRVGCGVKGHGLRVQD